METEMDNKPWYASQTIWGGIAAMGGGLGLAYYGYQHSDPISVSGGLTAAFGGLQSVIGRFKSTTVIGKAAAVVAAVK
jgi:hypothetical protein